MTKLLTYTALTATCFLLTNCGSQFPDSQSASQSSTASTTPLLGSSSNYNYSAVPGVTNTPATTTPPTTPTTTPTATAISGNGIVNSTFHTATGVYYENSSQHYCGFQDPSYLTALGGNNSGPLVSALPTDATYDGACQFSNAIFHTATTVYYENSAAQYCAFQDPSYLTAMGGGNVGPLVDTTPSGATYVGICQFSNAVFHTASTVYFENSGGHYCAFQDPSYFTALGGTTTGPLVDATPANAIYDGYCQFSNSNFHTATAVYYENTAGHYCSFQDPSYLMALGGNNMGPLVDAVPASGVYDGSCQPANMIFHTATTVYYENSGGHYCAFLDPSYLTGLAGGSAGVAVDATPAGAVYDGLCEPLGRIFNSNAGPMGSGAVYYENTAKHYCWIQSPAWLARNNGGSPGPYLDVMPPDAQYDGACAGTGSYSR